MKPGDLIKFKPEFNGPEFTDKVALVIEPFLDGYLSAILDGDPNEFWTVLYNEKNYHVRENEVEIVSE